MSRHWFLQDTASEFSTALRSVFEIAAADVCSTSARVTLGDEHDECQHLFSKAYALMQERQTPLSRALLAPSKIGSPVIEVRYYRSRVRRRKTLGRLQFVEGETGADFALAMSIDLPKVFVASRSVLGQCKVLEGSTCEVDGDQLEALLAAAGPEAALYLVWGPNRPPTAINAVNIACYLDTRGTDRIERHVLSLGQPLPDFFVEEFFSLWFGRNYEPAKAAIKPPATSVPILYELLHARTPPPNVVYFGITNSDETGLDPGLYVTEAVDL